MKTESNDLRLIMEALLVLLEAGHELSPVTSKIQDRLASTYKLRSPVRNDVWVPCVEPFEGNPLLALTFCNRRSGKGLTAAALAKIGVPWPPPPRWKRRLTSVLVDHFKFVKRGKNYETK